MIGIPLYQQEFFIHVGRGTVRRIAADGDRRHRHFRVGHDESHFEFMGTAEATYARFLDRFDAEIPELTPESLVAACTAEPRWVLS